MKSVLKTAIGAVAILAVPLGAASANEGMLLCHVIGTDNTISTRYFANHDGAAEKKYVQAHGLGFEIFGMGYNQIYMLDLVAQQVFESWGYARKNGSKEGGLGGIFVFDTDLTENPDGSVTGDYVRDLHEKYSFVTPETLTCELIQLDG